MALGRGGRVRPARIDDVAAMQAVERAAGALFQQVGMPDIAADEPLAAETLAGYVTDGRAWVSVAEPGGEVVGYAIVDLLDPGDVHLEQLSVHPDHGRQGRGRELVEAVRDYARAACRTRVTLATFRHVPWNAPLYARWGFRELSPDEVDAGLAAVAERERAAGLDRSARLFMGLDVPAVDAVDPAVGSRHP